MSEGAVQLACRDINDLLAKRYGKTVRYRVEYRVTKRYRDEPSHYDLMFVNLFDDKAKYKYLLEHERYETVMVALATVWNTIDILPGHG